jgi:UDP-N-acetylglucosamine diphosphorylase/glucosamine-1-phosphate N-acetyltransferase
MMIILFDDLVWKTLLPLTFTRPVSGLRIGILTITEKWSKYLNGQVSHQTRHYLQEKFPVALSDNNLFINGSVCPDDSLLQSIDKLADGEMLVQNEVILAIRSTAALPEDIFLTDNGSYKKISYPDQITRIVYPEDIFRHNDTEIRKDFKLLTKGRSSGQISSTNIVLGDNIFIEEGAQAECSTFNTREGPVYLGKNTQVWEGCNIRGSFALCDDALVKMGAKIYGMTTIGPHCKVGGEINNSVLLGYSSKGHEGFLGNSVLGEWCNIGADTNNSNMKNNYNEVRLWDYNTGGFRETGLQFCGLIMADHSKSAINTMFNTGTVVGVGVNVFGAGFPNNFVPDFSWGGPEGLETYHLEKMFETAEKVFERRERKFDDIEKRILTNVFGLTDKYRTF